MKDSRHLEFHKKLENDSTGLSSVKGDGRLVSLINRVVYWDDFMSTSAQIKTTLWFKDRKILKEIEPLFPHRAGYTDVLISFSEYDIYCEVCSFESIFKTSKSKIQDKDNITISNEL